MSNTIRLSFLGIFCLLLGACDSDHSGATSTVADHDGQAVEFERGPHGGRILKDGDFALELAIFETGVPPEFRAWGSSTGKPIDPQDVGLGVRLTRLCTARLEDAERRVHLLTRTPEGKEQEVPFDPGNEGQAHG